MGKYDCENEEIQVKISEMKSGANMTEGKSTNPSVQQGGQMGGRETGGCCDQVCGRIFFKVAKFFNSRMTYSNSVKLLSPNKFLAEKMTLKVEIPVF